MANGTASNSWWGRQPTAVDRTDFWQIGPLKLWLQTATNRMSFRWRSSSNLLDGHIRSLPGARDASGAAIEIPNDAESITCALAGVTRGEIVLSPVLPDREVVVRTREPVHVLPGDEVTFYLIAPLSIRLELADGAKLLHEVPTYRLSDTWFGPMSHEGSLCYASPSELYTDLRQVPLRPHCVITAVTIRNLGHDSLKIDRLNIPFPRLSLFYSQRTGFWTDRLTLERNEDHEMASLRLDRQPPAEASPTHFVARPRQSEGDASPVVRAFSAIFRGQSK